MEAKILDYMALLRDFGRIYTQKILSGTAGLKSDLKLSQVKAMYAFRDTDRLSAQELADMVGTKLCTATILADSLEKEGIVTRKRDPADRRKVMVTLTARGKKFRRNFLAHRHRIARRIFVHITSAEQVRLREALATVCEILTRAFEPDMPACGRRITGGGRRAPQPAAKGGKSTMKSSRKGAR